MPIESPCIGLCTLDRESNVCVGCFRALDEIIDWTAYNEDEKFAVIERSLKRRKAFKSSEDDSN